MGSSSEAHMKKWVAFEQDFLAGGGYQETPCFAASPGRLSASAFAETIELPFEDIMVPAPAGYDCFLTEMYGADYMELPSAEKRMCHSGGETNNDMIVSFTEPWTNFMTC